jgi:hypothetical protein
MEPFPVGAAAALSGLHDFLNSLPELSERRRRLQAARRRSDNDIITRFDVHWLDPCGAPQQTVHNAMQAEVVRAFGIAGL